MKLVLMYEILYVRTFTSKVNRYDNTVLIVGLAQSSITKSFECCSKMQQILS